MFDWFSLLCSPPSTYRGKLLQKILIFWILDCLSAWLCFLFNHPFFWQRSPGNQTWTTNTIPFWIRRPHSKHFDLGFFWMQTAVNLFINQISVWRGPGMMRFISQLFNKQDDNQSEVVWGKVYLGQVRSARLLGLTIEHCQSFSLSLFLPHLLNSPRRSLAYWPHALWGSGNLTTEVLH